MFLFLKLEHESEVVVVMRVNYYNTVSDNAGNQHNNDGAKPKGERIRFEVILVFEATPSLVVVSPLLCTWSLSFSAVSWCAG